MIKSLMYFLNGWMVLGIELLWYLDFVRYIFKNDVYSFF